MKLTYIIQGNPIPLKRARHGQGRTWDSQKNEKLIYQQLFKQQHKTFLNGTLRATVTFFIEMPKSWTQKKKDSTQGKLHTSKPDTSNLLKFIEDCGTGIIYKDDSQIASIFVEKRWADESSTYFTIEEIE